MFTPEVDICFWVDDILSLVSWVKVVGEEPDLLKFSRLSVLILKTWLRTPKGFQWK